MQLKTILIDDEPNSIDVLTNLLTHYCPQVDIVAASESATTGISLIKKLSPDLLFIDIEMPYYNGFSLLEQVSPLASEVVFVTAFEQYAIKAFRYNALDYLLKPIGIDELQQSVQKAERRIQEKQTQQVSSVSLKKICLPIQDGFLFIAMDDIIRCQAEGSYTRFFLQNQDPILVCRNIKEYETLLPIETFCRVHHSQLVNMNYVARYSRGKNGSIQMIDGSWVEISVRKKSSFFAYFNLLKK